MKPLGIIAGNSQFPILVAEEARRQNRPVVVIGIEEETDPRIEQTCDRLHWVALGQIKKAISLLKKEGVEEAVMAGQVKHTQLFRRLRLDLTAIKLLATLKDKKTDTVLGAVADEFSKEGIKLLSSTLYLQHLLAPEGVLTSRRPNADQKKDIEFGFRIAKSLAGLDLGQTVCVKDQVVLALEAVEGTDACIRRAGTFCEDGLIFVKVAKPRQDIRFDVPVIGRRTLESLREAKAAVAAVEAGKTLLFDKESLLQEADRMGLVLVGVKDPD
ncbi:MAG TPA: UDP-2,3-diacylglucosamine diphosphatase LpxI [Elusimicrobiota bacterium]|nr:UDP-2,3-diacylglucosamine diphosphatase LpxI [Elusimicrobiota bacterium]